MKVRVRKVEELLGKEYHVEYLAPFESWSLVAIFFNYKLAKSFAAWYKKQ